MSAVIVTNLQDRRAVVEAKVGRKSVVIANNAPGPPGVWVSMTQAAYDALVVKDANTLYVIIN